MDYSRQEREIERQAAVERAQELLAEQRRIGAFGMRLEGLDTTQWSAGTDYSYRHRCTVCGYVLEEFAAPILKATLRSKLCEQCIAWKVRQLGWQRWRLKHREG